MTPNQGQLTNGSLGDNAYVYVSRNKSGEGDVDLITIGPCCNEDYQHGPEKFMQPFESIEESDIVIWYVAQLKNSDTPGQQNCWAETTVEAGEVQTKTYPCAFGSMFTPVR